MIVKLFVFLIGVAVVHSQCAFRDDQYSPFYWKNYENICTEKLCQENKWLNCYMTKNEIMDQARAHYPEDILSEIQYLGQYFRSFIPKPNNVLPFDCKGACQTHAKQLQLERLFTNVTIYNDITGQISNERHMCIVIGPDIYYQQCGGECQLPYGNGRGSHCVPDVTVSMDIWVYCPNALPSSRCHKIRFDVPLSCTCKTLKCKRNIQLPEAVPVHPNLPPRW